jgi:hypothetical protein
VEQGGCLVNRADLIAHLDELQDQHDRHPRPDLRAEIEAVRRQSCRRTRALGRFFHLPERCLRPSEFKEEFDDQPFCFELLASPIRLVFTIGYRQWHLRCLAGGRSKPVGFEPRA